MTANPMTPYQEFIHMTRYSRWLPELERRESWNETVQRYVDFFIAKRGKHVLAKQFLEKEAFHAIHTMAVMPSMRALMTAGEALERENVAGFNCSYLAINSKEAFSESLYILMCGTGVGFSCERQEIAELPAIPKKLQPLMLAHVVGDSKKGWAKAYAILIDGLYQGFIPAMDYSEVRAAGVKLKTFGGRASGPDPLKRLFEFTVSTFQKAKGRRLNSLEVHDIMCLVGEIVVVGGVRRSALISLSNLSDQRMRDAKSGQWWTDNAQRALANNSVAYTEKPNVEIFMEEWLSLVKSKSGERGIFNREAAQKQAAKYGRRNDTDSYGTNPCSEIILRDRQFCNLTEVIIRADDTKESIKEKVRVATILGTFQCTLTDFNFLSDAWRKNTVEEALLGVSMTGIMDNQFTAGLKDREELKAFLDEVREYAVEVNKEWAVILGVNPSAAITAVKPSGTVSQLCDTASGIHARHHAQYIRTVRLDKKDPVYDLFKGAGMPMEDDVMRPNSTAVVSYAQRAPKGAITRNDMTAIEQLETWLIYQRHWCEHKPSVTISVGDDEWLEVGAWVYKYFDEVSGISFLPRSDHTYQQAPYQDITAEALDAWVDKVKSPVIDWKLLSLYERDDMTIGSQTLACTSGACELV
jgi:ribonucleoside-diphosphate reductase alpha chain